MNSDFPLVSIVAICYNQARYAVETLESIRNQTYPNIQLIIIDDCSTDNSVEVIQNWIDEHQMDCEFVKHEVNQGVTKTCNDGLRRVKGDYYQIIACDDLMMSDKLEHQVDFLSKNPNIGLLFGLAEIIDTSSKPLGRFFYGADPLFRIATKNQYKEEIIKANYISAPTVLCRTKVILDIGPYDENLSFEDWDMWIRLLSTDWQAKFQFKIYCRYRWTGSSISNAQQFLMLNTAYKMLKKHDILRKQPTILGFFAQYRNISTGESRRLIQLYLSEKDWKIFVIHLLVVLRFNIRYVKKVYSILLLGLKKNSH